MRTAVVLMNLGGPDGPDAVRPFLFNLFNDPAIIRLPGLFRWLIARLISWRRAPTARAIYAELGGGSPLLANTRVQMEALSTALQSADHGDVACYVAMRYWHPMSAEVAGEVARYAPDRVVLLPLYPQFSTTTTASSFAAWEAAARSAALTVPTHRLCCYPVAQGFVSVVANRIRTVLAEDGVGGRRVLFSAHGLPESIVMSGDPYQWQVERTVAAVIEMLAVPGLDWSIAYQSRVGPMKWIGPSTDAEVVRAGQDGVPLLIVPIAFVSEHSETLVELDVEYRKLAAQSGVPSYRRLSTVDAEDAFIGSLCEAVGVALNTPATAPCSHTGGRICPAEWSGCPAAG